jgi:hypothetical protein
MAPYISVDDGAFKTSLRDMIITLNQNTSSAMSTNASLIQANAVSSFGPAHQRGSKKTSQKPQSVSGNLRRSIRVITNGQRGPGVWEATIAPEGSEAPYGRRIELGFMNMTDSLGRLYRQPPYPFMAPGLGKSMNDIQKNFRKAWNQAMH